MATDKAINVRQLKATQELADALADLAQRLDHIEAKLAEITVALTEGKAAGKLHAAGQMVAKKAG